MNRAKIVSAFIIFFLGGCVEYVISPKSITVSQGNSFSVEISLNNCLRIPFTEIELLCTDTSDVYGVAFDINYDSTKIQFQNISLSDCVLSDVSSKTGFRNSSSDNGKLVVGISKQGQVSGEQGQGKIATITFQAIAQGDTELTFADPHLVNSQGEFIVGWPNYWASLTKAYVSVVP